MSFLRSSFFIAFVSLSVMTGFGFDLFGDCCAHHEPAAAEHGTPGHSDPSPANGDGCQCICHQVFTALSTEPLRLAQVSFVAAIFAARPDEFPPDTVPLGIEHPPQIA